MSNLVVRNAYPEITTHDLLTRFKRQGKTVLKGLGLSGWIRPLQGAFRIVARRFGVMPMQRVLRQLDARGVDLGRMSALEVVGEQGDAHTSDYADHVRTLEVWESDAAREERLREKLPSATIRITDSSKEVRDTKQTFDMVVVDGPLAQEHFEILPEVLRLLNDGALLVFNVIHEMNPDERKEYPHAFGLDQLARRATFYKTSDPEHVTAETMLGRYASLLERAGIEIDWHFTEKRNFMHYLVIKTRRALVHVQAEVEQKAAA